MIAHVVDAEPLLECEQEADQHEGADEDGRPHEYRFAMAVFLHRANLVLVHFDCFS